MANYLFFADFNGYTVEAKTARYDQGEKRMPLIWESGAERWVRATRVVIRKKSPSMHECDARCLNATGRTMQCECACGGRNHGRGALAVCEAV